MEDRQQPPIIATQHTPSRLPTSYVGAIRHYRRTSQNALNGNIVSSNQHKRDGQLMKLSITQSLIHRGY
ncbi:hypothetical protein [Secundilactobacillus similis]|uniref:hypothetical protein n=1 Tax=Secundilactobacillus similis TaxID=414682 RepID=UPI000A7182FA|nr:hypothetical protein [Secundilactobacillus similis]